MIPQVMDAAIDPQIEVDVRVMQAVIEKGRGMRDRNKLSMRTPLPEVTLVHKDKAAIDAIRRLETYIMDELNVRKVSAALITEVPQLVRLKCDPNHKALGARFGKDYKTVQGDIRALSHDALAAFMASGEMTVNGNKFTADEIIVKLEYSGDTSQREADSSDGGLVLLDTKPDAAMLNEAMAREVCAKVQKMRKEAGLLKADVVEVGFSCESSGADGAPSHLAQVLTQQAEYIEGRIGRSLLPLQRLPSLAVPLATKREEAKIQKLVDGAITTASEMLTLHLCRGCAFFDEAKMQKLLPDAELREGAMAMVHGKDLGALRDEVAKTGGVLRFVLDKQQVTLKLGEHLFLSSSEARRAGALR